MKKIKKAIKIFTAITGIAVTLIFSLILYGEISLPDKMNASSRNIVFDGIYSVSATKNKVFPAANTGDAEKLNEESQIRLFGTIPVKNIGIEKTDRRYVVLGGELIGIRLETQGVLVVGFDSFESENGNTSPAQKAGIQLGDTIQKINGTTISDNDSFCNTIENCKGNELDVTLMRNGKEIKVTLKPEKSVLTGLYKGGLWIRDCTGGIGTLTFADISKGTLAALGHGIYDVDTGSLMESNSGVLGDAYLSGVTKGAVGCAGELRGCIGSKNYGNVLINSEIGVYGTLTHYIRDMTTVPVAFANEVKTGKAQIVSTVNGSQKQYYDIEIVKVNLSAESKNLIIKITDENLLNVTGGIVQGMSGSPIIQDGMLVGAVTHVFLNDPTGGYGIFAQTMVENADKCIDEYSLQNAA